MVRMCPSFPIRSTMAQCSSRRCRWPKSSPADSRRRSPQPNRVAISARSRLPFRNAGFGSCQRVLASFAVSQFPIREPSILAHLTRRTLAANSGLSRLALGGLHRPRRSAAKRPLIVSGVRRRDSRWMRYLVTTVLLKESRGSEQYLATNSSIA